MISIKGHPFIEDFEFNDGLVKNSVCKRIVKCYFKHAEHFYWLALSKNHKRLKLQICESEGEPLFTLDFNKAIEDFINLYGGHSGDADDFNKVADTLEKLARDCRLSADNAKRSAE